MTHERAGIRARLKRRGDRVKERWRRVRQRIGLPSLGDFRRLREQVADLQMQLDAIEHKHAHAQARYGRDLRTVHDSIAAGQRPADHSAESTCVSVILLARGPVELTQRALESIAQQTHTNREVLLVCQPDADLPPDLIRRFEQQIGLRVMNASAHSGEVPVVGDVIAWMEDHTLWNASYLSAVVQELTRNPASAATAARWLSQVPGNAGIETGVLEGDVAESHSTVLPGAFACRRSAVDVNSSLPLTGRSVCKLITQLRSATVGLGSPPVVADGTADLAGAIAGMDAYHAVVGKRLRQQRLPNAPRVLYAVWDYPQLTETYVRWEIDCMRRWGVDVEVWSELQQPESPYDSPVPVHHGPLDDVIRRVQPDLVHFHWINMAENYLDCVSRAGLTATVRGHGYEFQTAQAGRLEASPTIREVYLFPHFAKQLAGRPKVRAMDVAFNPDLYYPTTGKDTRLVVRVGSAKPTKGVMSFLEVAARCPSHRFVLVLGRLPRLGHYVDEVKARNAELGSPVDIRVNVPTEEVAELIRRAGIYLHTYGDEEPFGMPISIAEAMATGCYVLARNLPGAAEYVGAAGRVYGSVADAVALIGATADWYPAQWRACQRTSIEFAHRNYADVCVLEPMLRQWCEVSGQRPRRSEIMTAVHDPEIVKPLEVLSSFSELAGVHIYGASFRQHLVGTWLKLREWDAPVRIRLGGLIHSVYLSRIEPSTDNRERLVAAVGDEAERLAYRFSACQRHRYFEAFRAGAPYRMLDRFTGETQGLSLESFRELGLVHVAEWLEKWRRLPALHRSLSDYATLAEWLGGAVWSDFRTECFGDAPGVELQSAA